MDFGELKTEDEEWARIPGEKIYVIDHSMRSSQLNKVKDVNQDIVLMSDGGQHAYVDPKYHGISAKLFISFPSSHVSLNILSQKY